MKTEYIISSIIITVIVLTINQTVNAQSANSTIGQIIDEKYGHKSILSKDKQFTVEVPATVYVNYESPSTVLISGDLMNSQLLEPSEPTKFNSDLWKAMDLLKNQYGFKLQNVMTSGVGSVGNPTTVYILMTK